MKRGIYRRLRRMCQPMILGQRSLGFWMAAALIFCWQGTRNLYAATLASQGSSQDENIRLEWDYDLAAGKGTIWIHCLDNGEVSFSHWLWFSKISLYTKGVTFDSVISTSNPENTYFAGPLVAGLSNGQNLYEYAYENPNPYGSLSAISVVLEKYNDNVGKPSVYEQTARIDMTFPIAGVGLYESKMDYSGILSADGFGSAVGQFILSNQSVPFVSVEMIPEPASIALMGLGGLAAAAANSKRRKEE